MINLVEQHIITRKHYLFQYCDTICFQSKNLYNLANYYIRQEFIKNNKWLRYKDINELLKNTKDYKMMPSQVSQQTLRALDVNWKIFFKCIKDWKNHKDKYNSRPKLPKYKNKEKGRYIVVFTNQQCTLKTKNNFSYIALPFLRNEEIYDKSRKEINQYYKNKNKNRLILKTKVNNLVQIRIVPHSSCYIIEVIYKKKVNDLKLNKDNIMGIDIGLNNLTTCVNNLGKKPFVINGKIIKSYNQYYNKKISHYRSLLKENQHTSKRIEKITLKRNNKIKNFMHKSSKYIIDYCIQNNVGTIVIGKNNNWKKNINLGKKNNQNFIQIPFNQLIQMIKYKANLVNIDVIITEESYTSKCSFIDNEKLCKKDEYLGNRKYRGLFISNKGVKINADVNGAYNIIKKVKPGLLNNLFNKKGILDVVLHPVVINI